MCWFCSPPETCVGPAWFFGADFLGFRTDIGPEEGGQAAGLRTQVIGLCKGRHRAGEFKAQSPERIKEPSQSLLRSWKRWILPVAVLGRSSTK